MGTLRSTALTATDDGYTITNKGVVVNGVELGDPVLLSIEPIVFGWDDSRLPSGTIDADGNVTVDGELDDTTE